MSPRRELAAFVLILGAIVATFLSESLFGGKVLSPADVLFVTATFREFEGPDYEPANRLLIDPVLQFQPWLEFNRSMFRKGRLPLWNDAAGCGTPHLANGQSAPFDPFHLIAYVGPLPEALAWIAFARLWAAGLGMFFLSRSWGLGPWGRWFAGLTYPLCGFLVVWLLFPVTSVAVWTPWLFLATDGVLEKADARRVGRLGLAVGCVFLGGHVQTSAHVLLAGGAYAAWRASDRGATVALPRALGAWCLGTALGLALSAVAVVPLWVYLGTSPVWADRDRERPSALSVTRPRLLDAVCTAVPYAFGSQRRGQPNLARALGVHNLNESAGGYAGLATLVWLAPAAWRARRHNRRVVFLTGLVSIGLLGAFEFPPVINFLRASPVLNVTDHRRLVLWVAFGLSVLGGIGLDRLTPVGKGQAATAWLAGLLLCSAVCASAAFAPTKAEPWLAARADRHYAKAAGEAEGSDPAVYRRRAERQVRQALAFTPAVLLGTAVELSALAGLAVMLRRGSFRPGAARAALLGLTVAELFAFGYGLNPAVDRRGDRPWPAVLARLRDEVGKGGRVLGVGEELPPNVAMRYGLADPRNYDSVESSRSLDWLEPLYRPAPGARSSRRTVTWAGVARAEGRLRGASVKAVVGASAPPEGLAPGAERVGSVWVARLGGEPLVGSASGASATETSIDNGAIEFKIVCSQDDVVVVRQTYDSGWVASVDGKPARVLPFLGTFLSVPVGPGVHRVVMRYDPPEVRFALATGLSALVPLVFALIGYGPSRRLDFSDKGLEPSERSG